MISGHRALEIIFAEREASVEGASSTLEDVQFSEYEDLVSVNSESWKKRMRLTLKQWNAGRYHVKCA